MTGSAPAGDQIGELIRRLRAERGMTQHQLAQQAGCSRSLIQQIEKGTRPPSLQLRERLSSALGQELPMADAAESAADLGAHYELRSKFNILLGRDPEVIDRALRIAQSIIDAGAVADTIEPLRHIADRQLERAEELLTQIPSHSATVWEWNTINDWLIILQQAKVSVRAIHTADLGTIGGDVGDDYHAEIIRLADDEVEPRINVQRTYVLDSIEDVWPYDDKLWRQTVSGVRNVLIKRRHARNAQSMLIVDDRYLVLGEYDYSQQARVATRFSALKHDVDFAIRRFERLDELRQVGSAIVVNDLLDDGPMAQYERLTEGDARRIFREALTQAWEQMPEPREVR